MVKIGPFWGPKCRHMSKFGESGEIIFSLKVSKNYFSQVYGHIFGQNWVNLDYFGGQNDVKYQNLRKLVK